MQRLKLLIVILILFFNSGLAQLQLQESFPNLVFTNPIDLQYPKDGTNRLFVVEQNGRIKVFQNSFSASSAKVFLDITDRVSSESSEMGLLGLAFHPDYKNNGYFYVNYTVSSPSRMTRISRFQVSGTNPDSAGGNSELILLTQDQPFTNHKGGQITFGPDGYLYIGLGDGGSGGDPNNYAQNKSVLLGKILRIDVNATLGSLNYTIPSDNPFKGNTQGWREEIYAYGLRNPWRFSFDPFTGWLWCGDVGQNAWEEIDTIQNGMNYGWRCYEGTHPYNTSGCSDSGYIFPLLDYNHSNGNCSIIGGFVYRGLNVPELLGKYIYADYCSKNIWSLQYDNTNVPINTLLLTSPYGQPFAFAIDQNKELYICASDGKIYNFKSAVISVRSELTNTTNYYLTQNYPNPFNPSTSIKFNIPEESEVHLQIMDSMGRIVKELLNEIKPNGGYELKWNASQFASGIYIVRMTAHSISSGRVFKNAVKMVYMK
jgi:glucose/arabinose dehydrogenase